MLVLILSIMFAADPVTPPKPSKPSSLTIYDMIENLKTIHQKKADLQKKFDTDSADLAKQESEQQAALKDEEKKIAELKKAAGAVPDSPVIPPKPTDLMTQDIGKLFGPTGDKMNANYLASAYRTAAVEAMDATYTTLPQILERISNTIGYIPSLKGGALQPIRDRVKEELTGAIDLNAELTDVTRSKAAAIYRTAALALEALAK